MKINFIIIFMFVITLSSCQSGDVKETPTKGKIIIYASETIGPLAQQLADRFEHIYTEAQIDVMLTSAREAVVQLLSDSTELILISRKLNPEEEKIIADREMSVYNYEIGKGGYGVIVNKNNPIEKLRVSQIDSILNGKIKYWKDLGWKGSSSRIFIYFPGINSEVFDYFINKFNVKKIPENLFTFSTTDSTISLISNKANSIAFIGLNYYDTSYNKIKFLEISDSSSQTDSLGISGKYFPPFQAYIYKEYYPLRENVYIHTNIKSVGLASGFVSFATGVQGQKIVLNNKFVPSTMPVRIVQLNRQEIK